VLVTGATGFLGRFLCLEWLERMAGAGGVVHALVRAPDAPAAAARLDAAFQGDPELAERFRSLAGPHLRVVPGDLAAPGLGLEPPDQERLAGEVDLIVHPGALVNHVLDYRQLFPANVAGTARLMALALCGKRKRFDFVSTVGVLEGARAPGPVSELAGVEALQADWPVQGGYAHGYALSKWAGEVLLRDLHERFGTPARVFRCALIMPHRRYRGQANVPDLLTRLLVSVIRTGLAPRSFYLPGQAPRAHFDGLPVDFIAAAMAALSSEQADDLATFQVSNAHWDDGVSLDTFMDWVEAAGFRLRRMADYGAWYQAFGARLAELPPESRQGTSLPILHRWAGPLPARERDQVDTSQFTRQVRSRGPGGEARVPGLDQAYLRKYLDDLRGLGLIGPGSG